MLEIGPGLATVLSVAMVCGLIAYYIWVDRVR